MQTFCMEFEATYIAIALVSLFVIAILVFCIKKQPKKQSLTPLAGLAFAMVILGIVFGQNQSAGYFLIGAAILLAVADIFVKFRKK